MVQTTRATTGSSSPGKKGAKPKDSIENIFDEEIQIQSSDSYCVCHKPDTGTPMIHCGLCKEWFHFDCINLKQDDAEEINIFVCPTCTQKTGRQTAMTWESDHALEVYPGGQPLSIYLPAKSLPINQIKVKHEPDNFDSDDAISIDSEDDFTVGDTHKNSRKRPAVASSSSSESENDTPRLSRKRRSQSAAHPPPGKRKKVKTETSAADDPARRYCLGKFQELFRVIFLRYPHLPNEDASELILKKPAEINEEEKSKVLEQATELAKELETCVYDTYGEPDRQGDRHAGPKYKDRFRMLQFNLSKTDRVVLHGRIVLGEITPKEISLMSSTDLANEETKKSIKEMEKEALEHSILQRTTAPRAKITHKGLQDIEDINGGSRDPDRDLPAREKEGDEKREKERFARLKTVQEQRQAIQDQRTRAASFSSVGGAGSPLSSPVASSNPSWGNPPPLPSHILVHSPMTTTEDASAVLRARPSLFLPTHSELDNVPGSELELNLADLINIDDEPSTEMGEGLSSTSPILATSSTDLVAAPSSSHNVDLSSSSSSPPFTTTHDIGNSPIMQSPLSPTRRQRAASFDLNSIWSGNPSGSGTSPISPQVSTFSGERKDMEIDGLESGSARPQETDDVDFDMILNDQDTEQNPTSAEEVQETFDALDPVWSGKVSMPLDSATPEELGIAGRQIGGRHLQPDSPLWKTLFPSDILRIDGRVPVDKSREYLLSMRMNPAKELMSVAFSPMTGEDVAFGLLLDFLIHKSRHGLVFPWGQRPKEHYPGRELYMVPLLAGNPLPDYIELLDDLTLPKIRRSNYLIGIWILNRGRLAAPPPKPTPSSTSFPPPPTTTPSNPSLMALGQIQPSVLAAEMASLTPGQVQLMLQTLTASGVSLPGLPLPLPGGGGSGGVPQASPSYASSPPPWPPQQSSSTPSQYTSHTYGGGGYHQQQQQQHQSYRGSPGRSQDYDDRRGGRGDFGGKRGGGGRARGRGGYDDSSQGRVSGNGWPRR